VRKPYDPAIKALVETVPEDWPVLLGLPRAPTTVRDADIATVSGAADKVLHVRAATPYLLHLEFETGHHAVDLPHLLHLRHTLLEHRHDLLVRSVAILLRPEADSRALTGVRRRGFPGEEDHDVFRYQVIRVWQLPAETLLAGGLGTLPLAPISAVTEADLPAIIERMKGRLGRRSVRALATDLWAATYILMGIRYSRDVAAVLLRGVISMEDSVTYQAILEEGEARGMVKALREVILTQGTDRFGSPDARVAAALNRIHDLQRLKELSRRLLSVGTWQELLALPPRRRGRRSDSAEPGS
jgi:predicted transposase YdaD